MFFFYGFGALLFVLQFPERWFPDKFDLWLSSHQLWHVCVLAAVVSWSSFCEGYVLAAAPTLSRGPATEVGCIWRVCGGAISSMF